MATGSKAEHYVTGMVLVLVGGFGFIGSITGRLAPMLAALWVPDALQTTSGSSAVTTPGAAAASLLDPAADAAAYGKAAVSEGQTVIKWLGQL